MRPDRKPLTLLASALIAGVLAGAAPAWSGTLEGRQVTFTVMTWDDPEAPYLHARGRTVTVDDGVEFGLEPEGLTGGLDVVPVEVEILPERIELTYHIARGRFFDAAFNGYVLRFETDCALFDSVAIDPLHSTLKLEPKDIVTQGGALFINTAGREYGPGVTLALDLSVADCPLS